MELDDYQDAAYKTATYPGQGGNEGVLITVLGIAVMAGALANSICTLLKEGVDDASNTALTLNIGSTLRVLSQFATEVGVSLSDCAEADADYLAKNP